MEDAETPTMMWINIGYPDSWAHHIKSNALWELVSARYWFSNIYPIQTPMMHCIFSVQDECWIAIVGPVQAELW